MSNLTRRRLGRRSLGQSLTEVIVIVFLVGVGCIGLVGLFGDNIRGLFGSSSESLAGNPSVGNPGQESNKTQWTLRGGSLSAYDSNNPSFNPGGSSDAPQQSAGGGGDLGGGFNPGGAATDGSSGSN